MTNDALNMLQACATAIDDKTVEGGNRFRWGVLRSRGTVALTLPEKGKWEYGGAARLLNPQVNLGAGAAHHEDINSLTVAFGLDARRLPVPHTVDALAETMIAHFVAVGVVPFGGYVHNRQQDGEDLVQVKLPLTDTALAAAHDLLKVMQPAQG